MNPDPTEESALELYRRVYETLTAEDGEATIDRYERQRLAQHHRQAVFPLERREYLLKLIAELPDPDGLDDLGAWRILCQFDGPEYEWFYGMEMLDGQRVGPTIRALEKTRGGSTA